MQGKKIIAGILLSTFLTQSVLAQSAITRGEIYKLKNQVDLQRQNQSNWKKATQGDTIIPLDIIRTGNASKAELLFNEGTLVRTGEGTVFRFPPGKRSFELLGGAALIMIRPGQGASKIKTPQAIVNSQGTALFVQHNASENSSLIGVLTKSVAGPVKVSSLDDRVTVELNAGQFVSIINGAIGLVEYFVLPAFYESVELAADIASGKEIPQESPEAQITINAIRAEALEPLESQIGWLKGLCNFAPDLNVQKLSLLLQFLGLNSISATDEIASIPKTKLLLTPIRSLTGVSWLSSYCQKQ